MSKGRTIFLETPRHEQDVSTAETFGPRIDLYEGAAGVRSRVPRPSVMDFERFTDHVMTRLDEVGYDPDRDWFVMTGSQLSLCLTFCALAQAYGKFKVLAYAANVEAYVEKTYDASWPASHGATSR